MPAVADATTLNEIALFRNLDNDALTWLNDHIYRRSFRPGTDIAIVEQPGEVVYLIRKGSLKIYVARPDGTEVILAILGQGDIVGEMSLVDSVGRCANVITLERSTLLWMDSATFQYCLETMPTMAYNLAHILSGRLRLANEQIQALAAMDVYGRVARQILAFADQYGQPTEGGIQIPIRLTQSDIADMVGASRERTNQVIVSYKRLKYISIDRDYRITVLNKSALKTRCQ